MRRVAAALALALILPAAIACEEDPVLLPFEEPICLRERTPSSYEVYFVIDVSGSMGPFLTDVKNELVGFANALPQFDDEGRPTTIEFFVVGFVNDVRWFPENVRRLRDVDQVQDAFESAIEAGAGNLNLNSPTVNAEPQENLLDALDSVAANVPSAEANLILMATDAAFAEAPDRLSGDLPVHATFARVRADLERTGVRLHAFVRPNSDGLTRGYAGQPALTAIPGSTVHDLNALMGARARIGETLSIIAAGSACN